MDVGRKVGSCLIIPINILINSIKFYFLGGERSRHRTRLSSQFPANREINRERLSQRRKPLYIIVFNQSFVLNCGRAIPLLGSAAGNISPKIARPVACPCIGGFGRASLWVRLRVYQRNDRLELYATEGA